MNNTLCQLDEVYVGEHSTLEVLGNDMGCVASMESHVIAAVSASFAM